MDGQTDKGDFIGPSVGWRSNKNLCSFWRQVSCVIIMIKQDYIQIVEGVLDEDIIRGA